MEMADATFDNSPLTRGKERRWLEAQNKRALMTLVVKDSSTDRVTNEQTPRVPKFGGSLIELV
jgi:hypothetical protein